MKRPETGYYAEPWIEYADHLEKEIERLKAGQIEYAKHVIKECLPDQYESDKMWAKEFKQNLKEKGIEI